MLPEVSLEQEQFRFKVWVEVGNLLGLLSKCFDQKAHFTGFFLAMVTLSPALVCLNADWMGCHHIFYRHPTR